jgi:hypothetical protein
VPEITTSSADVIDPAAKRRWTVMVFMGADGVEGTRPLYAEAREDIREMEQIGSTDDLNIFVQYHDGRTVPFRYHVGKGKPTAVPSDERDLTSGKALAQFVGRSLDQVKHQPHDHSLLVLWGHAYRFGIGHTETRAGIDAIDFAELSSVLHEVQEAHRKKYDLAVNPKLDIVGFDACDLASIEMAQQLHRFADYLLASQISIPLPGWPYQRILDRLRNAFGRLMGPAEFGTYVVRRYCETYHATEPVSLTLLDLKRVPDVAAMAEVLALRLATAIGHDRQEQQLVYELFYRSRTDNGKPFVDVADLCLNLMRECRDPYVKNAAKELGDLLISPPLVEPKGGSLLGAKRPFIAEHGRNATEAARLHGVSLYAPHVAGNGSYRWDEASYWYKKFWFAQNTMWSGLVHGLAQRDYVVS